MSRARAAESATLPDQPASAGAEPGPAVRPEPVGVLPSLGYGWPAWFTRLFPWAKHGGVTGPGGWTWHGTGGQPYQPGQL